MNERGKNFCSLLLLFSVVFRDFAAPLFHVRYQICFPFVPFFERFWAVSPVAESSFHSPIFSNCSHELIVHLCDFCSSFFSVWMSDSSCSERKSIPCDNTVFDLSFQSSFPRVLLSIKTIIIIIIIITVVADTINQAHRAGKAVPFPTSQLHLTPSPALDPIERQLIFGSGKTLDLGEGLPHLPPQEWNTQ